MLSDSFFQQGVTHDKCEDYAVHGDDYFVISDGCSNGGGADLNSDWGARLLCMAGKLHHRWLFDWPEPHFLLKTWESATDWLHAMGTLNRDCLTATIVAGLRDSEGTLVVMSGDGVYGGRKKDGSFEIHHYEFTSSAPLYLKYVMEANLGNYLVRFGNRVVKTVYTGDLLRGEMAAETSELAVGPETAFFSHRFPHDDFEYVFGATDGVGSFFKRVVTETTKENVPVPMTDALRVLLDVNHNQPGCLRLQRRWAFRQKLRGTFLDLDWRNADDVSVGLIAG